jgi:hypothetical protein
MNAARLGLSLGQEPLKLASALPMVPGFFMQQAGKFSSLQHYGTTRYG